MMHPHPFTTPRLTLRPFQLADAPELYRLNADPEVMRWIPKDEVFANTQAAETFLHDYLAQSKEWPYARWAVVRTDDAVWLGWCGLRQGPDGAVDLGYRFHRSAWGNGYATESGKAWIEQGFGPGKLPRIVASAADGNINSHRVLQRLGFRRFPEGDFSRDGFHWQRFHLERAAQGKP
ncbi:GNAT family N-acetyltransferase [Neolewinella lacunae]|uniref:GNAT family N-acetyltransferase n=1 Tax=Neolewinella lacunae TaxID=1517758 RepID=A0A923PKP9_9BACT|nr:GNAT family N-acetyltransferase [Neolewinella lacunae]MBC6993466.1 GNAT family N-acetyltransferase [Neolewinella lacunae]MDN3636258.1 GNAT family N-acetyltransferase [Neolewinella lacunae]